MKRSHQFLIALSIVLGLAVPSAWAATLIDLQMNEGAGTTTTDSSGNGNNGTIKTECNPLYPCWLWTNYGHTGKALEMIHDYIQVSRSATLDITGSFHASLWVMPYGSGTYVQVPGGGTVQTLTQAGAGFSKARPTDASGYGMYFTKEAVVHGWIGFQKAGAVDFVGPQGLAGDRLVAEDWNLIEIDFDGSQTYRLYVNGSLRYTGVLPEPDTVKVAARDLYVGHDEIIGSYIDGRIDEFKIKTEYVTPVPGNISGTITFQDFVGDMSLLPVRIEVKQGQTVVKSEQRTFGQSGKYAMGPFPAGQYDIWFAASKFRQRIVTGVNVQDNVSAQVNVTLLNGDLNGDNSIGASDADTLSGNFGKLGD